MNGNVIWIKMAMEIKPKKTLSKLILLLLVLSSQSYSCQTYEFSIYLGFNKNYSTSYLLEENIKSHDNLDLAIEQIHLDIEKQRKHQSPALFTSDIDEITYYNDFFIGYKNDFYLWISLIDIKKHLVLNKKGSSFNLYEIPYENPQCGFPNNQIKDHIKNNAHINSNHSLTELIDYVKTKYEKSFKFKRTFMKELGEVIRKKPSLSTNLQSGNESDTLITEGKEIIFFNPSRSELDSISNSDLYETYSDFNYHISNIISKLNENGFRTKIAKEKTIKIIAYDKSESYLDRLNNGTSLFGFIINSNKVEPRIIFGVSTDVDILQILGLIK